MINVPYAGILEPMPRKLDPKEFVRRHESCSPPARARFRTWPRREISSDLGPAEVRVTFSPKRSLIHSAAKLS